MTVRVFLSYRRDDTQHAAGRLEERLDERFKLFMDVDQIQGGAVFPAVVRKAVDEADVLLAVIGSHWLTLTAETAAAESISRMIGWPRRSAARCVGAPGHSGARRRRSYAQQRRVASGACGSARTGRR